MNQPTWLRLKRYRRLLVEERFHGTARPPSYEVVLHRSRLIGEVRWHPTAREWAFEERTDVDLSHLHRDYYQGSMVELNDLVSELNLHHRPTKP